MTQRDTDTSGASISLVITTYNRARLLKEALQSVSRCRAPDAGHVEVIVVDNNSTDATHQVVAECSDAGFAFELRHVLETRQGLSFARNRGAHEATAPIVTFMDDDQRMDANFLANLASEISYSDADCIGGPIFYYNADDLPHWLPPLLENTGQYDGGRRRRVLSPAGGKLNGGNMAFRASVLREVGGYDTALGRIGDNLLAGEEHELQDRLFAAGKRICYSPHLIQYHYLRPERRSRRYWRRHHFDYGRTVYRQESVQGKHRDSATLFGVPRWFWRRLLLSHLPHNLRSLARDPRQGFRCLLDLYFQAGQIYEARKTGLAEND